MIFESVISTIATLAAAGYAAHRAEQFMLARRGYDTRNFFTPEWRHCATCPHPQHCAEADACSLLNLPIKLWTVEDDRRQAQAFIDQPTAFWLDPNFFGDDPNWRTRLFPPPRIDPLREMRAMINDVSYGFATGQGLNYHSAPAIYRPENIFRAVMPDDLPTLPCGCEGLIVSDRYRSLCRTCLARWESRSNDPSRRSLGQGEPVLYVGPACPEKDGKPRTVTATHGDKPSMWQCECGIEFTAAGETKQSRKRRKQLAKRDDYANDLPLPPSTGVYQDEDPDSPYGRPPLLP